ncbi:MAG: diguanylate cyclase [Pseudomonadota bacterium]
MNKCILEGLPVERQMVLCVDDDPGVRDIMAAMVRSFGHECDIAYDGIMALEKIKSGLFTIVVTDLEMPNMNGIELVKNIKEEYPFIDVVAVTGYSSRYQYTDLIAVGASDFIAKPFHSNELQAKLNRIIRERALRARLTELSLQDGLTGLGNRRSFDSRLREEVGRALRQRYDLFLVLFDVDKFKSYNDELGHQSGDEVLKVIADVIYESTRKDVDVGYRFGGDEFAVIIPQANKNQCESIADRLLKNYEQKAFGSTSLSIGIAELEPQQREPSPQPAGLVNTVEEWVVALIERADKALYQIKRTGGNRVLFYSEREVL